VPDDIIGQCGVWWPLIVGAWGAIGGSILTGVVIYMRPWLIDLRHDEGLE